MIEGLTQYQTLRKLTGQERDEVCWKKGLTMTGQQSYQRILNSVCRKKTCVHQRSTRSMRKETWHIDVASQKDLEMIRTMSVSYWILEKRRFLKNQKDLSQEVLEQAKAGKQCILHSVATGFMLWFEVQALDSHEELSWSTTCDQSGGGAEIAGRPPNSERQCLMLDTVAAEFFFKIIGIKDGLQRFVKEEIEEEGSSPTKRSRRDQGKPRETSRSITSCIESSSAGKGSQAKLRVKEKTKPAKSMFNVTNAPKEAD